MFQWWYLRNRIMYLHVTQAVGNLLISSVSISYSRRVCSHVLNYLSWPPSLHLTLNYLKTFCITTLSMDFQTGMKRDWNLSLSIIQNSFPLYDRGFCTSFILCRVFWMWHHIWKIKHSTFQMPCCLLPWSK
jgi:hypothetical protein